MLTIKLDTPVELNGVRYADLYIETPIRAAHFLKALRPTNGATVMECFVESICGLPTGGLGELTIEDFTRVYEIVQPLLASFERLQAIGAK